MWREAIFILLPCECVLAYSILGILSTPSKSHNLIATSLLHGLAEKGHTVFSYTMYPSSSNLPNYKEIDISPCFPRPLVNIELEDVIDMSLYEVMNHVAKLSPTSEALIKCNSLMALRNTTQKFDVLITQTFGSDLFAVFSFIHGIPLINVFPNALYPHLLERMGSPTNPSYSPSLYLGAIHMNFFNRIHNAYHYLLLTWYTWYFLVKRDNEIIRQVFGPTIPPLEEITANTSVIFTNSHFSYTPSTPLAPGIVEVGGIQIRNASSLPENIEKFINEATQGVIYFSMGSLLRSETFPERKLNAFLHAFSKIPQRVIWKWGSDTLPGKSDNIMISKWMPQRDILAHPNIRLFISHGGLLGTSEAVYEGVPILGIPITYDQRNNIKAIEANGAGEILDYYDISNESVSRKIQKLIVDPKYKENMKLMSARYRDRPMSPIDSGVYWTEYVIKHGGAHHLKTTAARAPTFQYLLLDVIAFLTSIFVATYIILFYSIKVVLKLASNWTLAQTSRSKSATKSQTSKLE